MQNKGTLFTPQIQAAYTESELACIENILPYLVDNQKWNAIKDSLQKLATLQENLARVDDGLFEKLSSEDMTAPDILDAVIRTNFNWNKG